MRNNKLLNTVSAKRDSIRERAKEYFDNTLGKPRHDVSTTQKSVPDYDRLTRFSKEVPYAEFEKVVSRRTRKVAR